MDESSAGGFSWSGVLQGIASTATGYLDRRIDIDLQTRLAERLMPRQVTTQTPINSYVPSQVLGMNTGLLLPLLLVAGVAFVVLRK